MKPIKLTMTAFGPYRDKEIIDFSELKDNRIFVISGKTGAGKTTIFDAISFAIYGEASGADRENASMLRSDFADNKLFTSVDFIFEIRTRRYRVFRQLAHLKDGNKGIVSTDNKFEIYELIDGAEHPLVDRFLKDQVKQKIQELIGLNQDQFSQIVMLPQGEFRKLLMSDTTSKEEILRRLFKTWLYKDVVTELESKKKAKQTISDMLKATRDSYIQQIEKRVDMRENGPLLAVLEQSTYNSSQVLAAYAIELEDLNGKFANQVEEAQKAIKTLDAFRKTLNEAELVDADFEELEAQQKLAAQQLEEKSQMAAKADELKLAEAAEKILPYKALYLNSQTDASKKAEEVKKIEGELLLLQTNYATAEEAYNVCLGQESERNAAFVKVAQVESYIPIVKGLGEAKDRLSVSIALVNQLVKEQTETAEKQEFLKLQLAKVTSAIQAGNEQFKKLQALETEATEIKQKLAVLSDYDLSSKKLADSRAELLLSDEKVRAAEKELKEQQAIILQNQASIIAQQLVSGEACPVCGSHEHPKPAIHEENVRSQEEVEQKRAQLLQANRKHSTIEGIIASEERVLATMTEKVRALGIQPEEAEIVEKDLKARVSDMAIQLSELEDIDNNLTQLTREQDDFKRQLEQVRDTLDSGQESLMREKISLAEHETTYNNNLEVVPDDYRELDALERQVELEKHRLATLKNAWENAQDEFIRVKELKIKWEADKVNAIAVEEDAVARLEQAHLEFSNAMKDAGFTTEASYHAAKREPFERQQLKIDLDEYNRAVAVVKDRIEFLMKKLSGINRADIAKMRVELKVLETHEDQMSRDSQLLEFKFKAANDLYQEIKDAEERWQEANEETEFILNLFKVLKGENSKKLSFERYLQMEFLDKILESANIRLSNMSAGQYYLVRSERLESGGKQSGLSFDVFDNFTGQYRDVKTLSGGEKFNASLCLALAMADVIQAYEGGVSLETMFIDEGFGNLDEESLSKAIDTLIDLQQTGRMIGVISHVPELKQAIPAILEVNKTPEGYSYTRFKVE
jgi:exonuclease SbcC